MNRTKITGAATLGDVLQGATRLVFDTPPGGLSRGERRSLGVAALLLALAVASPTLLRWVWPELAFEVALRQGERVDPWGKPWVGDLKLGFAMACHSCGPNGIDEDCKGDDIEGIAGDLGFAIDTRDVAGSVSWGLFAWSLARGHFAGLGVLVLWLVVAARLWSAPRGPTWNELTRALVLAVVPILSTWLVALWLGSGGRGSLPGPVLIPAWIATAGSVSGGLYLAALARRLGRPSADERSSGASAPSA